MGSRFFSVSSRSRFFLRARASVFGIQCVLDHWIKLILMEFSTKAQLLQLPLFGWVRVRERSPRSRSCILIYKYAQPQPQHKRWRTGEKERSKLKLCAVCYNFKLSVLMENYKASSPLLPLLLSSFFSLFFTFFHGFGLLIQLVWMRILVRKKHRSRKVSPPPTPLSSQLPPHGVRAAHVWENTWYSWL